MCIEVIIPRTQHYRYVDLEQRLSGGIRFMYPPDFHFSYPSFRVLIRVEESCVTQQSFSNVVAGVRSLSLPRCLSGQFKCKRTIFGRFSDMATQSFVQLPFGSADVEMVSAFMTFRKKIDSSHQCVVERCFHSDRFHGHELLVLFMKSGNVFGKFRVHILLKISVERSMSLRRTCDARSTTTGSSRYPIKRNKANMIVDVPLLW
jgi:hypothetical protein